MKATDPVGESEYPALTAEKLVVADGQNQVE
jgi:hypothetical protein